MHWLFELFYLSFESTLPTCRPRLSLPDLSFEQLILSSRRSWMFLGFKRACSMVVRVYRAVSIVLLLSLFPPLNDCDFKILRQQSSPTVWLSLERENDSVDHFVRTHLFDCCWSLLRTFSRMKWCWLQSPSFASIDSAIRIIYEDISCVWDQRWCSLVRDRLPSHTSINYTISLHEYAQKHFLGLISFISSILESSASHRSRTWLLFVVWLFAGWFRLLLGSLLSCSSTWTEAVLISSSSHNLWWDLLYLFSRSESQEEPSEVMLSVLIPGLPYKSPSLPSFVLDFV